jgi:hypothetical protein
MLSIGVKKGTGVFERRGREGFAKCAEEEKKEKRKTKIKNNTNSLNQILYSFSLSFLRSLRNLRALCVENFPRISPV